MNLHTILQSSVSIYIPMNIARVSFSPEFIVCRLFDDGHSDLCEVITHCSFDLHFYNNEWCWASFHVFVSHLYVIWRNVCLGLFPTFFYWVVCFSGSGTSCLHILEINPLPLVSFAIIFSHSEDCCWGPATTGSRGTWRRNGVGKWFRER